MNNIHVKVYVTKKMRTPPINVVYGSSGVGIEIEIMDYDLPAGSTAEARATGKFASAVYKNPCTVDGNTITMYPETGFFVPGGNEFQVVITAAGKSILSFVMDAICDKDIGDGNDPLKPEQVLPLVQRAENAAAQSEAAAAMAQEVKDSIPEDYTTLSDGVNQLKGDLANITNNSRIATWSEKGKYIKTDNGVGNTIDLSERTYGSALRYAILECSAGDEFIINGRGDGEARLWCFVDANNICLYVSSNNYVANNTKIVAPNGAVKLILNDKTNSISYIGNFLVNRVKDLEMFTEKVPSQFQHLEKPTLLTTKLYDGYIGTDGSISSPTQSVEKYTEKYTADVMIDGECEFKVTCNFSEAKYAWFCYALYNGDTFIERIVPVPDSSTKIQSYELDIHITNTSATKVIFSFRTFNEANAVKIYDLRSKVNEYEYRHGIIGGIYCPLEIGDIYMHDGIADYIFKSSRVRTKKDYKLNLRKYDVIKLTDYTDARYYVGWWNSAGTFTYKGWLTSDYECTEDGEYIILISNITEVQTTLEALADLLVIEHKSYPTDMATEIPKVAECIAHSESEIVSEIVADRYFMYNDYHVKSINHRGYYDAPENTLSAYRLSKLHGFRYVETDVSFTSDDVAVLLHDNTIDRTSNGTGAIGSMTYEQASQYDFGSWKSLKYAGEKIPTFAEFVGLCRNIGLHPYIELKAGNQSNIESLIDIVKAHGMLSNVTWISFNVTLLGYIKGKYSRARLGVACNYVTDGVISEAINLKSDNNDVFIDAYVSNVDATAVNKCSNVDLPLEVWTVNEKETVKTLNPYISGITSDYINASRVLIDSFV